MWQPENQVNTVIIQPSPAAEAEILASMRREWEEQAKKKTEDCTPAIQDGEASETK
jgi:hypothetical protein